MFDTFKTYTEDLPLLRDLGLKPFEADNWTTVSVGRVDLDDDSHITIQVEGVPAQFWIFDIYCAETESTYHVETDSGTLSQYWPTVRDMAQGMIVVTLAKHAR